MPVEIDNRHPDWAAERVDFAALCVQVCRAELGLEATVSLVLVDDPAMAEINWTWLQHEGPTDVISFPQHELRPGQPASGLVTGDLLGDIVISVDTARGNAAELVASSPAWGTDDEVALYFVHGLLHLCGYDDQTQEQRAAMQAREDHHLAALGRGPVPRDEDLT